MSAQNKEKPKKPQGQDDDVVGKAYDSHLMRRLLRYLKPYTGATVLSGFAILIKAGADVTGPYLIKLSVDVYMADSRPAKLPWLAQHLSPSPMTGILQCAVLYMAALVVSYGLEFLQTYLMQWTGQRIMFDMRSQIFRHLQRMHIGFYDRNPVGRLVTRVTSDIDALNEMFTAGVLAIFEDIFVLLFIVIIMLQMSWPLALLTLSVLPLIMYATQLFRVAVRESYRRIRTAIAHINATTQEHVSGMAVVQLFNREKRSYDDFKETNAQHRDAFKDQVQAYSLYYPSVELLSSIAIAMLLWKGAGSVLHQGHIFGNTVTIGVLIAFTQYAQRFFRPIQDLSEKYNILQAAMAASERVFKLLDSEPAINSLPDGRTAASQPDTTSAAVEFRNVWFTYQQLDDDELLRVQIATEEELRADTSVEWILRGVSFRVERGETAAIVGHTGAGKTTITSLMMRFYEAQRGEILVDGTEVREWELTQLRRRFGVVLQDSFLFTGSIATNIRLGSDWITDEEVENAADEVNIGDFIRNLPQGFQEPVQERGATLSTGQKQLICFARALAHRPEVLILDEATSSVDTDTELRVRSALDRMVTGRTSIVIAHRLSTIQRADVILVMHKGRLREQGTHNELLTHHGLYWKLYRLQYKDQEATLPVANSATDLLSQQIQVPQNK